jgi:MoxR-like ATPase
MLKQVIDYPKMDEERLVIRQNLKGSYESKSGRFCRANATVPVREVYMDEKKMKIHSRYHLLRGTQKNIN